ncbi:helix-turn-helix domain-containing protein [Dinghuibacter silviterrae]|uniref:Helix-turn-helix protein n=1 Tax=Dinghuibacter silviterrae TaxID=1539049 RepID=A0A4R8DQN5_9BACT|nr:hypothetical protein [Dinghuibacter silviterrae]TDX00464.1 hypothetical protein EDB95_1489 [Dinghuibacter silviterrae]
MRRNMGHEGRLVTRARLLMRYSQSDLAAQLNYTPAHLREIESKFLLPSETESRISKSLKCTSDLFLGPALSESMLGRRGKDVFNSSYYRYHQGHKLLCAISETGIPMPKLGDKIMMSEGLVMKYCRSNKIPPRELDRILAGLKWTRYQMDMIETGFYHDLVGTGEKPIGPRVFQAIKGQCITFYDMDKMMGYERGFIGRLVQNESLPLCLVIYLSRLLGMEVLELIG